MYSSSNPGHPFPLTPSLPMTSYKFSTACENSRLRDGSSIFCQLSYNIIMCRKIYNLFSCGCICTREWRTCKKYLRWEPDLQRPYTPPEDGLFTIDEDVEAPKKTQAEDKEPCNVKIVEHTGVNRCDECESILNAVTRTQWPQMKVQKYAKPTFGGLSSLW